MVAELESALRDLGSAPSWFGPSLVELEALAGRVRRWLVGQHDGDTFARCSAMANRTGTAYESALEEDVSSELSKILRRHYDSVAKTCTDFAHARGAC